MLVVICPECAELGKSAVGLVVSILNKSVSILPLLLRCEDPKNHKNYPLCDVGVRPIWLFGESCWESWIILETVDKFQSRLERCHIWNASMCARKVWGILENSS